MQYSTQEQAGRPHDGGNRGRPADYDEDRQVHLEYLTDWAREFNDQVSLKTLTSRAVNRFPESGLSREAFLDVLYKARAIMKERRDSGRAGSTNDTAGSRPAKRKMIYFCVCHGDRLGLREDGPSPQEHGV